MSRALRVIAACGTLCCALPFSARLSAQCTNVPLASGSLPGTNSAIHASRMWDPDGAGPAAPQLVVGGSFSLAGTVVANNIAAWDPAASTWATLGSGIGGTVRALTALSNGDLLAAGDFLSAGGAPANFVARWNGTSWAPLGSGLGGAFTNAATSLAVMSNGDVIVAGSFLSIGTTVCNHIARWNGTTWSPLGAGLDGPVNSLAMRPNGDVIAGGRFTHAGTVAALNVARWNGTAWSPLGAGLQGAVNSALFTLATTSNGDIVAGGKFDSSGTTVLSNVARFGGLSWYSLGTGTNGEVYAVQVMPNGDVVVGGQFTSAGGVAAPHVARWNATAWSGLGSGSNGSFITALHVRPNGDLIAGGSFSLAGGVLASNIARWDGVAWSALGSGTDNGVVALTTHGNGDLFAGGGFTTAGGAPANHLARWNGTSWSPVGSGTDHDVLALAARPNGELAVGGAFAVALGVVSPHVVRIATTCPALATSYGAGCTSSAGPVSLAATSLPWLGGTYRATTTGMPASSIALDVLGLTQVDIALPSILPEGVAGCSLLASPDLLGVLLPAAGTVQTLLPIPSTAALINQLIHHQVAPLELGPAGIIAITSSNGLTLTLGSF